ncbi:hypothetical protein Tco_0115252 [Tanacetum coccineum]
MVKDCQHVKYIWGGGDSGGGRNVLSRVLKGCRGACVFTDKWSLDELAYGVPRDGPYQTNPPSPDDIISYIQNDQEGQVTRTSHRNKIDVHTNSSNSQLVKIWSTPEEAEAFE